jgi:hypothetical protein
VESGSFDSRLDAAIVGRVADAVLLAELAAAPGAHGRVLGQPFHVAGQLSKQPLLVLM